MLPSLLVRLARYATLVLVFAIAGDAADAGVLDILLGSGGTSGKLAKFQFGLKDDMAVTSLAWSPDGRYIAVSSNQNYSIYIWDLLKRAVRKKF
jgi:WD40 repeat protein